MSDIPDLETWCDELAGEAGCGNPDALTLRRLLNMARGAWNRTAAILEFIAAHGGVKTADREKLNPYRNKKAGGWTDVFSAGRAMMEEKKKRPQAESMNGSQ